MKESVRKIVDLDDVFYIKAICESWAKKHHYVKMDRRHNAMKDAYDIWIDGKDARVTFQLYDYCKKDDYGYNCDHTRLLIVMRKRGGNYIIIGRSNTDRMIEIDRTGYEWHYDYEGLKALIGEYPELFDNLGVKE